MIPMVSGVRVWIATGHTNMRRGMNTRALTVQEALKCDPHGGDLYVYDGFGMSLYANHVHSYYASFSFG
jgi:transposase